VSVLPFDVFFGDRAPSAPRHELIVDSFAGGGGASTGIEMALGRSPDFAINHDPEALALHAANHPHTVHLSKNVWHVDPLEIVNGAPVGLAWFSPDCKHFSKAKGGKPVKRHIRDLAWVVVHWAKRVRPRVIMLENVEEFRDWGPITAEGKPCPDRKGQTFQAWMAELKRLGYRVEWRELRACDYGAPTIRKRLFLIARRDGRAIVWPEPTHGKPTDPDVIAGRKLPWRTAAEIIDWSLPCPSIFLTKEEGRKVGCNRPLADATMARIAKGVKRYVLDAAKPFIVSVAHGYSGGRREYPLEEPIGTVTSGGISHGVVVPHVSYAQQGGRVRSAEDPLHTVTASTKDQNTVVAPILAPHVMTMRSAQKPHNGADEPTHTITAGGAGLSLVAPQLVGCGGRAGQSRPRGLDEPMHTATAKADTCLTAAHLTKFNTGATGSDAEAPVPTVTAAHSEYHPGGAVPLGLVAASIVKQNFGSKPCSAVDEPLHTVTTQGNRHQLTAAFLAQHNTGVVGHTVEAPLSTVTAGGDRGMSQQAVVSAGMLNLRGSDRRGADVDAPLNTVTGGGTHAAEVRAFLLKYYGSTEDGQGVEDPLHTVTALPRFGLVTIEGELYEIADIGMRMLKARELYRAQGFPDTYRIDIEFNGRPLPQSSQTRMCGNSVCPPMARALVAANCPDLAVLREAAE
jgi:DNA (cytosine-5)-methyltransferase 1